MPAPGTQHRRISLAALRASLAVLLIAAILAGTAIAGPFEDAVTAIERGDYATALRLLRPLADQGYPVAQNNLGVMYEKGNGVPQDYAEAVTWYRRAADQGLAYAQYNLGLQYANGQGVRKDFVQAHMWLNLAVSRSPASETEKRAIAIKNRNGLARLRQLASRFSHFERILPDPLAASF